MSTTVDLAALVVEILKAPGALRVDIPVLSRRKGEPANDLQAAIAKQQLCVYVMPPFPTRAMQGVDVVFYEGSEIRIRISEKLKLNRHPATAYDLMDDVARALHWQPVKGIKAGVDARMLAENCDEDTAYALVKADPLFQPLFALGELLAHPLQLAEQPVDMIEDPDDRLLDVIFGATFQLNPTN